MNVSFCCQVKKNHRKEILDAKKYLFLAIVADSEWNLWFFPEEKVFEFLKSFLFEKSICKNTLMKRVELFNIYL